MYVNSSAAAAALQGVPQAAMDCESPSAVQQHRLLQMKLQQQQQPWMTMNMVELPHPHSSSSASQGGGGGDRHSSVHNPVDSSTSAYPPQQQAGTGQYGGGLIQQPLVDTTTPTAPQPINVQLAGAGMGNYSSQPLPGYVVTSSGGAMYNQPAQQQVAPQGYDITGQGFVGAPVMWAQIRTSAGQQGQQAQQQRGSDDSPMVGVCVQQSPTVATH